MSNVREDRGVQVTFVGGPLDGETRLLPAGFTHFRAVTRTEQYPMLVYGPNDTVLSGAVFADNGRHFVDYAVGFDSWLLRWFGLPVPRKPEDDYLKRVGRTG